MAVRTKKDGLLEDEEEEDKPEDIYYIDMENKVIFNKDGEKIEVPDMDEESLLAALSSSQTSAKKQSEEYKVTSEMEKEKQHTSSSTGNAIQIKFLSKDSQNEKSKVILVEESAEVKFETLKLNDQEKPMSLSDRFPVDDLAVIFDDYRSDKEMEERELTEEEQLRVENAGLQVFICVNGWLWKHQEVEKNFNTVRLLNPSAEVYSLQWESEELIALGTVRSFLTPYL